jgi:hypothetical protein
MPRLIIEAANEIDTPSEDLAVFADALREADETFDVRIVPPHLQRGYGVTGWEVIRVWVESKQAWELAKDVLLLVINAWITKRMAQRIEEAGNKEETKRWWVRPTNVTIFGPDGEPLSSVEYAESDSGPRINANPPDRRREPPSML